MMTTKEFLSGMRPKTLAAAFIPPIVAFSLSYGSNFSPSYSMLFFCLGLAISLQIATNFYNDAIDFLKGADVDRVGPSRIVSQGNVSYKHALWVGHFFILLTLTFALPIFIKGGILFVILGILSVLLAYGYTGGPFPLAYLGLGELFVFLFFGLVATIGSYYLLNSSISLTIIIQACVVGIMSTLLIAINNFRDRFTDIKVNKRTLATRMKTDSYLLFLDLLIFLPYLIALYLFIFVKLEYIFVLLATGIAHKIHGVIHNYEAEAELNQALSLAGKHLVVFCLLMSLANVWN